jgi:plastocyanin
MDSIDPSLVDCARRRLLAAPLFVIALGLASAGAAAQTAQVRIEGSTFLPAEITVKAGTTVQWTNDEKRTTHSVLFLGADGFESERFFPGESWVRRFDRPGRYPYTCGPHPEMKGLVVVTP